MVSAELDLRILKETTKATGAVTDELKKELQGQGHVLTGTLLKTMTNVITSTPDTTEGAIVMQDYYQVVNTGISANRIPYNRGSGKKSSKYIDSLIRFWKIKKGLSDKEAKSAAFALANKHKKEGMFTANSKKFASLKRRFGFFNRTIDNNATINKLPEKLEKAGSDTMDSIINKFTKAIK